MPIANVSNSLAYYSGLEPMYGGDIALAAKMLKHMVRIIHKTTLEPRIDHFRLNTAWVIH